MGRPQLHKRLTNGQVKTILLAYEAKEISSLRARISLGVGKTQFFNILKRYRRDKNNFSVSYKKHHNPRKLSVKVGNLILDELKEDQKLIKRKDISIKTYNYSAIKRNLDTDHNVGVSVTTIINKAKKYGYYLTKGKPRRIHDREVITRFPGELVQHDSSHHQFSPYMKDKLYLITSLDDYSRRILYAQLFEKESTWAHILAFKHLALHYGCPLKYYVDQHSIFRFVKDRDKYSAWVNYQKFTDDVNPQWKQVLSDCNVEVVYALSPQAKGKIERPYRWLQDNLVRIAARKKIHHLTDLREVLNHLVEKYNSKWIHSTTKEIPVVRFEKALNAQQILFKPFQVIEPYEHVDDIFCLRVSRQVDCYHKVSLDGFSFKILKAIPREILDIRITPTSDYRSLNLRFWQNNVLIHTEIVPVSSFKKFSFKF